MKCLFLIHMFWLIHLGDDVQSSFLYINLKELMPKWHYVANKPLYDRQMSDFLDTANARFGMPRFSHVII